MESKYTVTIYAEDNPGVLARIINVFSRCRIKIDTITGRAFAEDGQRYVLKVTVNHERILKLVRQILKQVDVITTEYSESKL
jgi:acetolactate synthase-1/3 small subunit